MREKSLLTPQDLFRLVDVAILVRLHERLHRRNLAIALVRLGLLAVERVDLALGEHVREDEVLEDLDPLRRPGFVVGFERFEEVDLGFGPVLCA